MCTVYYDGHIVMPQPNTGVYFRIIAEVEDGVAKTMWVEMREAAGWPLPRQA